MIGKIVTGKSFGGAVAYVLKKEKSRLLESDGVDTASVRAITDSFNFQRKARREIAKVVGHISLSFHRDDAPKLSDERMRELAAAYMERMGIANTQYLVARHNDTEHPHLHIIYNRVKYDRTLVPNSHERRRNVRVCKELKRQYGLTFSRGKEHIKTERLHGADKVRQELFDTITRVLPKCERIAELAAKLKRQGIGVQFVRRSNDPKKAVQGVTFTKGGMTFKGSQIDRQFSYAGLEKLIRAQVEKRTAVMAAKELENYLESRREQAGRATPELQSTAKPPQPAQVKGGKMPQPLQVVQGETFCPQPRQQPQGPSQMQPPQPKPQPTSPENVEKGGTAFTPEQWRQLQQNRTLRVIVRSREVNMLRQYWFDSTGALQYTLVALRRRDEPFTRELVVAIKGHLLTAQEQKQLYSGQGLTKAFRKQDGTVYRSRFGVVTKPGQKDILTECVLAVQQVVKSDIKPQVKQQLLQQQEERPQVKTYLPRKRGRGI